MTAPIFPYDDAGEENLWVEFEGSAKSLQSSG